MAKKNVRELKVCAQSGYNYRDVPQIQLKGAWLREWGFSENTPISVQCEDGRLVITPRPLDDEEQRVTMVAEAEGGYEKPERKHYVRCK